MEKLKFKGEYITLVQTLKKFGMLATGGEFHQCVAENNILINDEVDNRKGRKLRHGDIITINGTSFMMENINDN